jgi:hypothetical protein
MMRILGNVLSMGSPAPTASDAEQQARQHLIDSLVGRGRDSLAAEQAAKTAHLDESYRNRQDAMTRLALTLSRISPAAAMSHAVEVMSGTDFEVHRRWRDDLVAYRGQLEAFLKAKGVQVGGFRIAIRTTNTGADRAAARPSGSAGRRSHASTWRRCPGSRRGPSHSHRSWGAPRLTS